MILDGLSDLDLLVDLVTVIEPCRELYDITRHQCGCLRYPADQLKTFKRPCTTEGDISLATRKGSRSKIDRDPVEGKTLALMDSDGPRKSQRILLQSSHYPSLTSLLLLVVFLLHNLPDGLVHIHFDIIVQLDYDAVLGEFLHRAERSVHPS